MVAMEIDLNSDLGEGCGLDAELMPLVTSANICCGFHAGDAHTARETLALAARHGVQVGAHPGYPDREHFGRLERDLSEEAVFEMCLYQVGALAGLARSSRRPLEHIKPHGALYNQACRDEKYARPIVAAAQLLRLAVIGLPGSRLAALCPKADFIPEGFADRRYQADGALVPRSRPDAFIEDAAEAVRQAERLIRDHGVQTLCVHGDNPRAVSFVKALRAALTEAGFTIRPFV
jgi:UPF0271 protein